MKRRDFIKGLGAAAISIPCSVGLAKLEPGIGLKYNAEASPTGPDAEDAGYSFSASATCSASEAVPDEDVEDMAHSLKRVYGELIRKEMDLAKPSRHSIITNIT